jgi:ketosteroid isomerase-like protein
MDEATKMVTRYWTVCEARDWSAFGELLAPDVVYELPQTRERIRGRATYVEFNATYPGDWHLEIVRVTGDDRHAASWTVFRVDGTEPQPALCFFDLDDAGLITHISDFWPVPYDPPPGREHLTERY